VKPTQPIQLSVPYWCVQLVMIFALHAMHLLFDSVRTDHVILFPDARDYWLYKADEVTRALISSVVVLGAWQWIQTLPRQGALHKAMNAIFLLCAAAAGVFLPTFLLPYGPVALRLGASASLTDWVFYTLWAHALTAILFLAIVGPLQARRDAVSKLAEVQEQGRLMRRQVARARLQAIQTRVDPQWLFDRLTAVKHCYEIDAPQAEALLDDLTRRLRAALPGNTDGAMHSAPVTP